MLSTQAKLITSSQKAIQERFSSLGADLMKQFVKLQADPSSRKKMVTESAAAAVEHEKEDADLQQLDAPDF